MQQEELNNNNLLHLSADKNKLMLVLTTIQDKITVQALTQLVNTSPYKDLKLKPAALNDVVTYSTHLQNQTTPKKALDSIVIAEREDAKLTINIDSLKMIAKATITSAYGGNPITIEHLTNEINRLGIKRGILRKTASLLLEKSSLAKPGKCFQATIAKGRPPVHGTDSLLKRLVKTPQERLLIPQKNKDGSVDMRNLGELITVKPGNHLMRKIPHTEGLPGMTIMGKMVKHRVGRDIPFLAGLNTEFDPEDENLLVSTLNGIPKISKNGMKVDDVLVVNDVGVGNGHINYNGSVIVQGDVSDGMEVTASGDITVSGFVESARIECGGDLIVGKGIIGRKIEEENENYSCQTISEGSVTAHFSQYSKIIAGTEVNIKKQLLHCDVSCQGDINVIDESGHKGNILGGLLRSAGCVNTVSLGASAGSKTIIDLVGNYPILIKNKNLINSTLQNEQAKLQSLNEAHHKISTLPDSEKKQVLDGRLILTKEQVAKAISDLRLDLEGNTDDISHYFEQTSVITKKEVFNDVYINIGTEKFHSVRDYGPTKVSIKTNKIVAEPYKK